MPQEYVDTTANGYWDYALEIPFNMWLRGEKAKKTGFMATLEPKAYDIFGFLLKKAGYPDKDIIGNRVPSQFAQQQHRSGQSLRNCAHFLTTSGHADTDTTIRLGIINDDEKISDLERQTNIATILKGMSVGVKFVEKCFVPLTRVEAVTLLSKYIEYSGEMTISWQTSFLNECITPLYKSHYKLIYTSMTRNSSYVYMFYDTSGVIPDEVIHSGVLPESSSVLPVMRQLNNNFAAVSSTWFGSGNNRARLTPECQEAFKHLVKKTPIKRSNTMNVPIDELAGRVSRWDEF